MKYWKRIQLEHVETIQHKTLQFLSNNRDKLKSTYCPLNFVDYCKAVPEILTAFAMHNIKPIAVAVYIMRDNNDIKPHKDRTFSVARVNIPILNCEGTWTLFHRSIIDTVNKTPSILPSGVSYQLCDPAHLEEVDRVSITEPTIIRPQEIHSVIMKEENSPRITLTVTCNPDPKFMLEHE